MGYFKRAEFWHRTRSTQLSLLRFSRRRADAPPFSTASCAPAHSTTSRLSRTSLTCSASSPTGWRHKNASTSFYPTAGSLLPPPPLSSSRAINPLFRGECVMGTPDAYFRTLFTLVLTASSGEAVVVMMVKDSRELLPLP